MTKVIKTILQQSDYVDKIYEAQTKAFSSIEYPFLIEMINTNNVKEVLDVGTGEGNFIIGLSNLVSQVKFSAIDSDPILIDKAKKNLSSQNIIFNNSNFNADYSNKSYDMLLARFSVEHMENVNAFILESSKRIVKKGLLVVTEWYVDNFHSDNQIWIEYRQKELELYNTEGSHPRLALKLPSLFKKHGFQEIYQSLRCISQSTIGKENFYTLVIEYVKLYNKINPNIFDSGFSQKLIKYFNHSLKLGSDFDDTLMLSQTVGRKI